MKRGAFLGWFVELVVPVQPIFAKPWLLQSAQYKISFPSLYTFSIPLFPSSSKLGRPPCWVAYLLVFVSDSLIITFCKIIIILAFNAKNYPAYAQCLPGGYKEMSSILADQQRPWLYLSPNAGRGGSCGLSANENSCAHHVTWIPNKLWIFNFIFYLWCLTSNN